MSEPRMIYVVWDTWFDEGTPLAYFSTKAGAEAYASWLRGPSTDVEGSAAIESCPLDPAIPTTGAFVCAADVERRVTGLRRVTDGPLVVSWSPNEDPTAPGSAHWHGMSCRVTGRGPTPEAATASAETLLAGVLDSTITEPMHGTPFIPGVTPDDFEPTT